MAKLVVFTVALTPGRGEALEAARALQPDVILAMLHWGSESDRTVTASQERIARPISRSALFPPYRATAAFTRSAWSASVFTSINSLSNAVCSYKRQEMRAAVFFSAYARKTAENSPFTES